MTQEEKREIVAEELKNLLEKWRKQEDEVFRRRALPIDHEEFIGEDDEEWVTNICHSLKTVLELL